MTQVMLKTTENFEREEMSIIEARFTAPTSRADYVEGVVVRHDKETGRVILLTDDGDTWSGYEYQLE